MSEEDTSNRRTAYLNVTMTPDDRKRCEVAAQNETLPASTWAYRVLRARLDELDKSKG